MNDWKYVVFGEEVIVIFPPYIEHSTMKSMEGQMYNSMNVLGKITSAGFVNVGDKAVACYGKSTSLGLSSSVRVDSILATRLLGKRY